MNETTSLRWRAHAAKAAVNYHTLDDISEKDEDKEEKQARGRLCCCGAQHVVLDGVAAAAVASSILSWQATSNILVKTASTTTLLFGPYVAYQSRKLKNLASLRQAHNNLRGEVNYLANENERLQRNLCKLDSSVAQLERVERELSRIAGGPSSSSSSYYNVKRLVNILKEQTKIQQRIQASLKSKILSTVLGVVCKSSNADGDFQISEKELQVLIVRLNMMDGVYFREGNFRTQIASGANSGVSSIMSMIRTLLQENDETVFSLRPEELTKR